MQGAEERRGALGGRSGIYRHERCVAVLAGHSTIGKLFICT